MKSTLTGYLHWVGSVKVQGIHTIIEIDFLVRNWFIEHSFAKLSRKLMKLMYMKALGIKKIHITFWPVG